MKSKKEATRKLADYPSLFAEIRQPDSDYLLIPRHTSENRRYIPFGFLSKDKIIADSCSFIPDATPYDFGIMSSAMHMTWMRYICGRLEGRYRYSNTIVYNNFPWPEPTGSQKKRIEDKAQAVLEARAKFTTSSLADLYDPNTMPPALLKTHQELDKAVDSTYRKTTFKDERSRIEFLFNLYQQITEPLFPKEKKKRRKEN